MCECVGGWMAKLDEEPGYETGAICWHVFPLCLMKVCDTLRSVTICRSARASAASHDAHEHKVVEGRLAILIQHHVYQAQLVLVLYGVHLEFAVYVYSWTVVLKVVRGSSLVAVFRAN